MPKIKKTFEYRRARWLSDEQNLEDLTRNAWGQFGTQSDRTILMQDNRAIVGLQSKDFGANSIAIHCARYTDRQGIGTIPMTPAKTADIGERSPDLGENFLNSDFMALIKDNHVIGLNCGRNAGSLRIYLEHLFRKAKFDDATRQFELVRIGSPDKLAMIVAAGVKRIDMNVDISEAHAAHLVDGCGGGGIWNRFQSGFGKFFSAVTESDKELKQIQSMEKGSVTVSINVQKSNPLSVLRGLDHLAEEIAKDDEADDFTIHLRDGKTTIKSSEVSVRKQVRLESVANSVSVGEAWNEMNIYLSELSESGQIEA